VNNLPPLWDRINKSSWKSFTPFIIYHQVMLISDEEGQNSPVIQGALLASHSPTVAISTISTSQSVTPVHTITTLNNEMIDNPTDKIMEESKHAKPLMDNHLTMETTITTNDTAVNNTHVNERELENGYDEMTTTTTTTPVKQMSWKRSLILFVGLALTVFLCSLDQTIVATAIPRIASEFNGLNDVAWIGSAYLLTTAAVTPLYGRLTAIFGLKPVFLFALTMFLAGSLGCALSSSMMMLIIFRAVSGIGGESMYALALVIITGKFKYNNYNIQLLTFLIDYNKYNSCLYTGT
jgi:hypothetical protein